MGFKVRHINCATMRPRGGRLLLGAPPEGQSPTLVCHCLLIETDSGLVLIDSGFGLADLADPARRIGRAFAAMGRPSLDPAETARHQIEALGYQARDVRHIILTHLDLDHAGGLSDFPDARVHLYRKEYEAGTKPKGRERFRYRPAQWAHGPDWALYDVLGEAWHGFECVRQLQGLPPEILIVPLTGHTRGHAGVAVATAA